jgi:hypothetical protein
MSEQAIHRLVDSLLKQDAELRRPFPYLDCRKLKREAEGQYDDLIPDLASFFYWVSSHAHGVEEILNWPEARLRKARDDLAESFFEQFPQYRSLENMITPADTPDLSRDLIVHEQARRSLVELITRLLNRQRDGTGDGSLAE